MKIIHPILCLSALSALSCSQNEVKRPNIIFIMSDDHAEKAISCYGHGLNNMPNIDRLAREGVRFSNATVTNSISAPSRAVILTGLHSHMNGHMNNEVVFDGSQQTFPKLLQQAGYSTALIGKWHLRSLPTGFDHWMVLPEQGEYYNPDFIVHNDTIRISGYVTDIITDETIKWLDSRSDKQKPFCLVMQHKAPHRNWMPAPKNLNLFDETKFPLPQNFNDDFATRGTAARHNDMQIDKIMNQGYDLKLTDAQSGEMIRDGWGDWFNRMDDDQKSAWMTAYHNKNKVFNDNPPSGEALKEWKYQRYMQDYMATVQSVDESVGAILKYLDKNGLSKNTIVVYTSDQGFYLGEHGWFDKRFMYEESLSTPLLIRYPKAIKKGWVSNALVQNLDFAQTFLDYAGVDAPNQMQGMSMRPLLEQSSDDWRDAVYYHYFEYPGIHSVKRHYGIRTDRYKLIHFYFDVDEWELYDLKNDPHEMNNLIGTPDAEQLTADLKMRLGQLRQQYHVSPIEMELEIRHVKVENKASEANISLATEPDAPYDVDKKVLVNGAMKNMIDLWATDYTDFLGFNGTNLNATFDLGRIMKVNEIKGRFLHKPDSWIYAPDKVNVFVSADNINFTRLDELIFEKTEFKPHFQTVMVGAKSLSLNVRYILFEAQNTGIIPKGDGGAGNRAWLLCDEIFVN